MIQNRFSASIISLTVLGLALMGLALDELSKATSAPEARPSDSELFVSSFDRELEGLRAKNAVIRTSLAARDLAAPTYAAPTNFDAETKILDQLENDLACDTTSFDCVQTLKSHLENLEARVLLDGLKFEDRAGLLLRQVLTTTPALSKITLSLLQEFRDGSHLLQAFTLDELTPDLKAQLIEAGLDPADETLKTSLYARAKALMENMLEQGSLAEAYAAVLVIPLFPEMAKTDFERMGQSLCRFSAGPTDQDFIFENLKLRLRRQAGRVPRLQSWLTACKG